MRGSAHVRMRSHEVARIAATTGTPRLHRHRAPPGDRNAPPRLKSARPEDVLDLQRTAGNAAVAALVVQRKGAAASVTLRFGSRGIEVQELQSALNQTDEVVTPLAVDGHFGPTTNRAVRQFQAANPPLVADGVVGPITRAAIDAAKTQSQDEVSLARKLFERGAAAYSRGQFGHAYDFLTRAYEMTQRSNLVFSRAQCLRRLGGQRERAIALYEQYVTEGGERAPEAARHLAELRGPAATGDETTDTAAAKVLFGKGAALYAEGKFGHAYDELTKAYNLVPRPNLVFSRAQCLRRLGGRREEAIVLYEQYLAGSGGDRKAEAATHVAELRGPGATGEEATDTAAARALFDKGAALYAQGKFGHAYDELTKAYDLVPRPTLVFSRAQCLRRLGDRREDAAALFEQYIAMAPAGDRVREARFYALELRKQGAVP